VDEAAEAVAAVDIAAGRWLDLWRFGLSKCEPAVWALPVVVLDEDPQNVFEVAATEDQQPVETFVADGPDESLRVGVVKPRFARLLKDPGSGRIRRATGKVDAPAPELDGNREHWFGVARPLRRSEAAGTRARVKLKKGRNRSDRAEPSP